MRRGTEAGRGHSLPRQEPVGRTRMLRLERCVHPEEQGKYIEVPFAVPPGIERVDISYTVHSSGSGSVIDLGLRDGRRMRGWSGGARSEIYVGTHQATPGYREGEPEPGEWAVVLGAYRVDAGGCEVSVEVYMQASVSRWLCGDLHMHTDHSDGIFTADETAVRARAAGLDFIALTDHNTSTQNAYAGWKDGLLVIPGMELTTDKGHCNLYGIADPLPDFRAETPEELIMRLAEARAAGAYIALNHPHCPDCGWHFGFDVDYDWVEVWNGPWREANAKTLEWWQKRLSAGHRITAVGGSDTHRPHPLVRHGMPAMWVYASGSGTRSVLGAIQSGRVAISCSPAGPFAEIGCGNVPMGGVWSGKDHEGPQQIRLKTERLNPGDQIRLWSERGLEESYMPELEGEWKLEWEGRNRLFWRAEVWRLSEASGEPTLAAMSNPVYIDCKL